MAMHPSFADWYRSVGVAPQAAILEARWAGIEELSSQPNAALLVELARLFTMPSSQESAVPGQLRDVFKKHDTAFLLRDNLQELRVLAGVTLRTIIDADGELSPLAALAVVCGSFGPRLAAIPGNEHVTAAQEFIVRHAKETRESATPAPITVPGAALKAKITKTLTPEAFGQSPPANLRDPLIGALNEICTALSTTCDQAQKAITALTDVVAVREEELGILWWLHARFSSSNEKTFSELGYTAGTIVFPFELAELTSFVPGPESLAAVVVRALQEAGAPTSSEPITLAGTTNAVAREVRQRVAAKRRSEVPADLTPILLAISTSLETDGAEDWLPVYRKACDIPTDRPFPAASLSLQLYHELMLVRASSEA